MGHWLGTGNIAERNKVFLPFAKAHAYVLSLKLKGSREWQQWCKSSARLATVPTNPNIVYKDRGWQSSGHWLGTAPVTHSSSPFIGFLPTFVFLWGIFSYLVCSSIIHTHTAHYRACCAN